MFFLTDATSEGTLKVYFTKLSNILDTSTSPSLETKSSVGNVHRALADRGIPWLMVFDNYNDPQSYNIQKFIPGNELGIFIVTCRHKDAESCAGQVNHIELTGLDKNEAI
jgi:hypothetical protein